MRPSEGGGLTRDPTLSDWSVGKRFSVIMIWGGCCSLPL